MATWTVLAAALLAAAAGPASAQQYIRDEIRVNMRAGPGLQFKILRTLVSGEAVTQLGTQEDWIRIRMADGDEGWVPGGYVVEEAPASVALPSMQAKLASTRARIEELDRQLAGQTEAITELDTLRERNDYLEVENSRLSFSSTWKNMATGAGVVLAGILIGFMIPRGTGASRSKLKL